MLFNMEFIALYIPVKDLCINSFINLFLACSYMYIVITIVISTILTSFIINNIVFDILIM